MRKRSGQGLQHARFATHAVTTLTLNLTLTGGVLACNDMADEQMAVG